MRTTKNKSSPERFWDETRVSFGGQYLPTVDCGRRCQSSRAWQVDRGIHHRAAGARHTTHPLPQGLDGCGPGSPTWRVPSPFLPAHRGWRLPRPTEKGQATWGGAGTAGCEKRGDGRASGKDGGKIGGQLPLAHLSPRSTLPDWPPCSPHA